MSTPPFFLKVVIQKGLFRNFCIWLPFFLFLPFIYLLLAFVGLTYLVVSLVALRLRESHRASLAFTEPFRLFHAIKGTQVEIDQNQSKAKVRLLLE